MVAVTTLQGNDCLTKYDWYGEKLVMDSEVGNSNSFNVVVV